MTYLGLYLFLVFKKKKVNCPRNACSLVFTGVPRGTLYSRFLSTYESICLKLLKCIQMPISGITVFLLFLHIFMEILLLIFLFLIRLFIQAHRSHISRSTEL